METYELRKKAGVKSSVYAIALVENPAIEVGFVALSKDGRKQEMMVKLSEEQRMIYTPVLIPEQKIYREDENGEGYNIFFTAATIREAAHDFVTAKLVDNFNNEHQETEKLKGITLVENWIIDNPKSDKSTGLGFDLPVGTWMAGIKINDEDVWLKCKNGTYKGISIEGLFDNFTTKFDNNKQLKMEKNEKEVSLLTKLADAIKSLASTKLMAHGLREGGAVYTEAGLEDGVNIYSDEALEVPAGDGDYELEDGQVLVVSEGKAAGLREAAEVEEMKNKEQMNKIEELAGYLNEMLESHKVLKAEFASSKEELSTLKEELASYKKESGEVKAELSKVKSEPAGKSVAKLSEQSAKSEGRFGAVMRGEYRNL